jgi:hypothetical protein
MKSETLKQNLNAIRDYISGIKEMKESSEVQLVRSQLRVIEKSIRQFERDGIQVPEGVMGDKLSLEFKIEEIKKGPHEISLLYEELLDIIVQTGRILKRRPDRDLRDRLRESRKRELPRDILRKNIVAVLKEMGGNGHERDVLKEIGDKLKEQFTPADIDTPSGRRTRWEINTLRERNRMIKDGILTPDSKRKKWTLVK